MPLRLIMRKAISAETRDWRSSWDWGARMGWRRRARRPSSEEERSTGEAARKPRVRSVSAEAVLMPQKRGRLALTSRLFLEPEEEAAEVEEEETAEEAKDLGSCSGLRKEVMESSVKDAMASGVLPSEARRTSLVRSDDTERRHGRCTTLPFCSSKRVMGQT